MRSGRLGALVGVGLEEELDVSDAASVNRAVANAGPFDILVNNAGVLFNERILESPEHFFCRHFS